MVKTYIDWAVKQDFAVIDVNLPKHVSDLDSDPYQHQENDRIESRTKEATQLLTYVWENYIELNESSHIFLMGTNTGHGAILNFIKSHEGRAQQMLTKAISFVEDVALTSCKSLIGNDQLPGWYYEHSLVFVSGEHNYWESDYARKPKKRFGRLSKSSSTLISDMLLEHRDEVLERLREETSDWKPEKMGAGNDLDMSGLPKSPQKLPPVHNFALHTASSPRASENGSRALEAIERAAALKQ